MQKKLIALAIAGLSGAAFAQSNVTIYGVMDATYDNVSANGATAANSDLNGRGRVTMNSSYIGFKGTESLGNGLAVAFQIETGLGEQPVGSFMTNASGNTTGQAAGNIYGWAGRDTYVGLAGSFGTVAFGNLTGPTRALGAKFDVNSGATGIGANTALLAKLGGGSGAGVFDQRIANGIAYISPNVSGFSGVVAYAPNENRGNNGVNNAGTAATAAACVSLGNGAATACGTASSAVATPAVAATAASAQSNLSAWTVGLNYDNGPLTVGFAWTKAKDSGANSIASGFTYTNNAIAAVSAGGFGLSDATDTRLGVKYDFGMGTVGLLWDQMKATTVTGVAADGTQAPTADSAKQTVWYLPVTFNVGGGKVLFQYGKANKVTDSLSAFAGADTSASHVTLGYEYNMSKRTSLKAVYSKISNASASSYDFLYGASAANTTSYKAGVARGADPTGVSFGLRHSF